MRIMGLDVGTKTIGVALSDELGLTAQPVKTIKRTKISTDMEEVLRVARQYSVEKIVVGFPLKMDGTHGDMAGLVLRFMERLGQISGIPVVRWDERFSTAAIERVLISGDVSRKKRKEAVDKLAASYILQGYLDSLRLAP